MNTLEKYKKSMPGNYKHAHNFEEDDVLELLMQYCKCK